MKPSTKAKVISKLNEIKTIIEKCGGAGGTPGPCPTSGGAGAKPVKLPQEHIRKEAEARTAKAHALSKAAGDAESHELSKSAVAASKKAVAEKDLTAAKKLHLEAEAAHNKAAHMHANRSLHLDRAGNKEEAAKHDAALYAHYAAARAHEAAAKGKSKVNDNLSERESSARPRTGPRPSSGD